MYKFRNEIWISFLYNRRWTQRSIS